MLTKRTDNVRTHQGQVSFPGGSFEAADATLERTALREAHEEVGLDPAHVRVLGVLDDLPTFVSGFQVRPFVAEIPHPYEFVHDVDGGRPRLLAAARDLRRPVAAARRGARARRTRVRDDVLRRRRQRRVGRDRAHARAARRTASRARAFSVRRRATSASAPWIANATTNAATEAPSHGTDADKGNGRCATSCRSHCVADTHHADRPGVEPVVDHEPGEPRDDAPRAARRRACA